MIENIITGALLVVALIHILPVVGFFGQQRVNALYDIEIVDKNIAILMRHRAILFGILGSLFAYAAFKPALQPPAMVAAAFSIASFFYLAFSTGGYNKAMRRVVGADIIAAIALALAIALRLYLYLAE